MDFKYVWHSGCRFLARRKGGERAHVFATAADLQAIQTACNLASARSKTSNITAPNNSGKSDAVSGEAAQSCESAATV